jgi:hypothetical protein
MTYDKVNKKDFVFIVYAPQIQNWSAGNRALHNLCGEIAKTGFNAWVAIHGPINKRKPLTLEELRDNVLTKKIQKKLHEKKQISIGIYPETVKGNPLNADITVSWILNYAGLLGNKHDAVKKQIVWSYSDKISVDIKEKFGISTPTLFLPVINLGELRSVRRFYLKKGKNKVLYCQKYRALGGTPKTEHEKYLEIHRFGTRAQSREELLRILRTSHELIVYENTTAILEAQLLGTPVRCISNDWFKELIAAHELPKFGISWDQDPLVQITSEQVIIIEEEIENLFSKFRQNLINELNLVLNNNRVIKRKKISLPSNHLISMHSVHRLAGLLMKRDFGAIKGFSLAYLKRNLWP